MVQANTERREILAEALRSFARDTPLMRAFRETFDYRQTKSWLAEGKESNDLLHRLTGALCSVLSVFEEPRGLPSTVPMVPVDAAFLAALTQAIDHIPSIVVDRYFFLMDRHSVPGDGKERIADVILGCLQDYVRNGRARGAMSPNL